MTQRQYANNAKGQLLAGISSIATTMLMKGGMEDRFPTHNGTTDKDYYVTLKKYDTDGSSWLKQEIILVTKRVGNSFTITRSAGHCPASSSATTQTNTAFAFDADDYIELTPVAEITKEMRDEINTINSNIDAKLSIAEYISGSKLFANSSTGTDDYEITLSDVTSLTDGMRVYFEVDVANTGSATLNVSSTGAKDLKIFGGDDLQTGYISAGQIIEASFDSGNDYWEVISVIDGSSTASVSQIKKDVILGEDITAGDELGCCFLGKGKTETVEYSQSDGGTDLAMGDGTKIKVRDTMYIPIAENKADILISKKYNIKKVGTPADNIEFSIYADDGTTLIATLNAIAGGTITNSYVETEIVGSDVDMSSYVGKNVLIEISRSGGQDASNYYNIECVGNKIYTDYYDGSARNQYAVMMKTTHNFKYDFTEGNAFSVDTRYASTSEADGIIVESGVLGSSKPFVFQGELSQSSCVVGGNYFVKETSSSNTLTGTPTTEEDATEYVEGYSAIVTTYFVDKCYVDKLDFETKGTYYTSGEDINHVSVYLNGVLKGTYNGRDTSYVARTLNIQEYVEAGRIDVKIRPQRNGTRPVYIKNQVLTIQDYDTTIISGAFTNTIPTTIKPFSIGKGQTDTGILLVIDKQKFGGYGDPLSITAGSSPYTYTNETVGDLRIQVTGGTVSAIAITILSTDYDTGNTSGIFTIKPGEGLKITYSAIPTITLLY